MNPTTKERANFEMINALIALIPMIPTNNGRIAFNFNFNNKSAGNKSFFFKSSSLCLRAVNECEKKIELILSKIIITNSNGKPTEKTHKKKSFSTFSGCFFGDLNVKSTVGTKCDFRFPEKCFGQFES